MEDKDTEQNLPEQSLPGEPEGKSDACEQNRWKLKRILFTGVFAVILLAVLLVGHNNHKEAAGNKTESIGQDNWASGIFGVSVAASGSAMTFADKTGFYPQPTPVEVEAPTPEPEVATTAQATTPPEQSGQQAVQTKEKPERIRKDLDSDKPMVALTFDDGPYGPVTKRIIKVLKEYDGRGTFFVVGNRISSYKKILKKTYQNGNLIGNHTYDHKKLTALSDKQIQKQVKKTRKAVKKVTGKGTSLVRPPYGAANKTVKKNVKAPMINWNVDSEDWSSRNKKKILKKCNNLQDGDIVLMHDIYTTTADAVEKLVPKYTKKGYQFVTVEELFYYKGIKLKKGKLYFHAQTEEK